MNNELILHIQRMFSSKCLNQWVPSSDDVQTNLIEAANLVINDPDTSEEEKKSSEAVQILIG